MIFSDPFFDEDGDFVVLAEDGNTYYVDATDAQVAAMQEMQEMREVAAGEAQDWSLVLTENLKHLEHRLARPLTDHEREVIAEDCATSGQADTHEAYLA